MLTLLILLSLISGAFAQTPAVNSPVSDAAYSYQVPVTGFSITVPNGVGHMVLDPAGTLATGTVTMPAVPTDGQIVEIITSQTITLLTVNPNAGQSIKASPATLALGNRFECLYRLANTTWYC